jgi:hypothetical protein
LLSGIQWWILDGENLASPCWRAAQLQQAFASSFISLEESLNYAVLESTPAQGHQHIHICQVLSFDKRHEPRISGSMAKFIRVKGHYRETEFVYLGQEYRPPLLASPGGATCSTIVPQVVNNTKVLAGSVPTPVSEKLFQSLETARKVSLVLGQ